jgi:hypothetical protein
VLVKSSADFVGTHSFICVNPATVLFIYYQLPELKKSENISIEVKDAQGNVINNFTSIADSTFLSYDGGPQADPTLPKSKGLNRFVWNLRYPTMDGIPNVYIESSYRGHKTSPGKYMLTLKFGEKSATANFEILSNPLYGIDAKGYQDYHTIMSRVEGEVIRMHKTVNSIYEKRNQLEQLLASLPADERYKILKQQGADLIKRMKAWDEDMVQRKSKAYDDVENFPNKFTANYMFALNHMESDIPRVTKPSLDRIQELDAEWKVLEEKAKQILDKDIPAINKQLWEAGVGAVWKK